MWTGRLYSLAGCAQYGYRMGLLVAPFPVMAGIFHHFAGQGPINENRFAINMCNASSFMIQGFDMCLRHGN